MRALSIRDGKLAIRDVAKPVPGSGQILVRTLACAICASDHHHFDHPELARNDRTGLRVDSPEHDVVMGHEYCAEVVEYGPDTDKAWPVGTRVTGIPVLMMPTGQTRIIGYAPDAPGGYGEYFLMNEFFARPVPNDIPVEIIAVNDAMAVGWYFSRVGTEAFAGKPSVPLVIGLGAIGVSIVIGLKQRGAGPIVAADFSESRRKLALEFGADVVVDPAVESPYAAWRRVAWGSPDEVHDYVLMSSMTKQVVYECAGKEGVLGDVLNNCAFGARVFSAGGPNVDSIPTVAAHLKGINIQFGGGPQLADWYESLDLVVKGKINLTRFVGETVTLDQLPDAFDRARRDSSSVRIVYKA